MSIDSQSGWAAYLRDSHELASIDAVRERRHDAIAAALTVIVSAAFIAVIILAYLPGGAQ